MKITVLGGAGKVCYGAIQDFIENEKVEKILLADLNLEALNERKSELQSDKIVVKKIDLNDHATMVSTLTEYDVCLNASSHIFNLQVMKACVESKTNYTDFGGLFHWAIEQLKMNEEFEKAGIVGIVGSGSAPGIVNVMAKYGYDNLDTVESIHIRDGIVNFGEGEDDFIPPYAIETLLDEYIMNPYVFQEGKYVEVTPFSGAEEIRFPDPVGKQTVINTIHSEVATMPMSFKKKGIQNVTFKLALPKSFEEKLRFIVKLGLGSNDEVKVGDVEIKPRKLLAQLIQNKNNKNEKTNQKPDDHKVLRVEVEGKKADKKTKYIIDCVLSPYEKWPEMSQGVFSVGFPAAVTTRILGEGLIKEKGFFASEQIIPTDIYFKELKKRGIKVEVNCIQTV